VRGDRTDLNGPFLAREALRLGLEPARVAIVGDAPAELEATLRDALSADAVLVSREIEAVSRSAAERLKRDYADFEAGVTKQATVPEGAISLGLAGTAPGLVVPRGDGRVLVVLPGPPSELQRLWPRALETDAFQDLLARARPAGRRVYRLFGVSESAVARALAEAGGDGSGVEVTICAREFEIHVDVLVEPGVEERADALEQAFLLPLERWLYGRDERTIEEHVLELCRAGGLTLATAESCTGGLVAARLTSVPGSSDVVLGGVVAYSDDVKRAELDVPAELIERHGAVSAEVAAAMARGARARLGADVAVAVTGIAGPDGGTPEKPVGLVYLHAEGPDGGVGRESSFPGDRVAIRSRAAVGALHLVRRLLSRSLDEAA